MPGNQSGFFMYQNIDIPYPSDFNKVIRTIRRAVIESNAYTYDNIPGCTTPMQLWNYLKPRVTFVHDTNNNEDIQRAQTLFDNNIHGIPGAGDCDCYTVLVTSACITQGFPVKIVLAGRNRQSPVHIYNVVKHNGKWVSFDLTEPNYGDERHYPFKQYLPVQLK